MASIGVAHVDMETDERPDGTHTEGLKKARDMAQAILGRYYPTVGTRAACHTHSEHASTSAPATSSSPELNHWNARQPVSLQQDPRPSRSA
jgi:hypothetical protein